MAIRGEAMLDPVGVGLLLGFLVCVFLLGLDFWFTYYVREPRIKGKLEAYLSEKPLPTPEEDGLSPLPEKEREVEIYVSSFPLEVEDFPDLLDVSEWSGKIYITKRGEGQRFPFFVRGRKPWMPEEYGQTLDTIALVIATQSHLIEAFRFYPDEETGGPTFLVRRLKSPKRGEKREIEIGRMEIPKGDD